MIYLNISLQTWKMHRSSTKAGAHKPSYGAFLDVDVEKDKFISLRALVS
jgi:hypothetical protein